VLKLLRLAEYVFICVAFVYLLALIPTFFLLQGIGRGDLLHRVLGYGVQGANILLIFIWRKRVFPIFIKEKLLWVLIAIALVSVFWSDKLLITIGDNFTLIRVILFGIYFGTRYSLKEQVRLLAWMLGIVTVVSILFILALPSHGVMGMGRILTQQMIAHQGRWQGIFGHKNTLGRNMVLSSLVFLLFTPANRKYRWVPWIGFVLSVLLIEGSGSKTSLIILLTIILLLILYRTLRWKYQIVIPFLITLILVGGSISTLLVSNAEAILGVFGRDLTLTGRTDLWMAVLDKIWERPWLGYGYGAFWSRDGEAAMIWSIIKWEAVNSHNGFLDIWLELGLLGLSVFTFQFILNCCRAVSCIRQTKNKEGFFPLAYLTFLFMANLTESSFFKQDFLWSLYVALTLSMHSIIRNTEVSIRYNKQKSKAELTK